MDLFISKHNTVYSPLFLYTTLYIRSYFSTQHYIFARISIHKTIYSLLEPLSSKRISSGITVFNVNFQGTFTMHFKAQIVKKLLAAAFGYESKFLIRNNLWNSEAMQFSAFYSLLWPKLQESGVVHMNFS